MVIDKQTVNVMNEVLSNEPTRKLFATIATLRIAEVEKLRLEVAESDSRLSTLEGAHLISRSKTGKSYFITALGIKVARDLAQLPTFSTR